MYVVQRFGRVTGVWAIAILAAACGDEEGVVAPAAVSTGNQAPVINGTPSASVIENEFYSFLPAASDPDGDPLVFGNDGVPGWLKFDTATGRLWGTPGSADVGMHGGIDVWVSDGINATLLPRMEISVLPASAAQNRAPVMSGSPAPGVIVGDFYDFVPVVSDADGDALEFSVQNLPGWAAFDSEIGRISGTPGGSNTGVLGNITISVTDGIATASLGPFFIVVNPPPSQNTPPTISGDPASSVLFGASYSFVPTGDDFDGDPISFSVINPPGWAQFSPVTGSLSGVPARSDAGHYDAITIAISDGTETTVLPSFSIEVIDPNSPPTISGNPDDTVLAGDSFSFVPSSDDPDGDGLSFSISNRPSWANFNSASGALTGNPGAGAVGTYDNISITVSDGFAAAVLNTFSINVVPVGSGSATLSWTPPTENIDGSPLNNLTGYVVYWGTASGSYSNSTTLASPGLTTYVVDNLLSGTTYFFSTKAYNSVGLESSFSNEASKTIP